MLTQNNQKLTEGRNDETGSRNEGAKNRLPLIFYPAAVLFVIYLLWELTTQFITSP